MSFLGLPYPITKHPLGLFRTQSGINQIKSDLLVLLLTEPGERVMLPEFGTPLKRFFFEPNDSILVDNVKQIITDSIKTWEPRIAVTQIEVTNSDAEVRSVLDTSDKREDIGHILLIRILFADFNNIRNVQELKLEIPLGGQ
jgi:phage baseplate assembly protein W